MGFIDRLWHKTFRRPYRLAVPIDQGKGKAIVFVHGLAGSSEDWRLALPELVQLKKRIVAVDLLGAGTSPKPDWIRYSTDDHAKALINTIDKKFPRRKVVLVGHSMGALIAVRVARMRPDLVSGLVLYQLPTYVDLPEIKAYNVLHKVYRSLFDFGIKHSNQTIQTSRIFGKFVSHMMSGRVNDDNWLHFEKSLQNTVLDKGIHEDLKALTIPIDMIFGKYDMLVIEGSLKKLYKKYPNIKFHAVRESHVISRRTGQMIAEIIG